MQVIGGAKYLVDLTRAAVASAMFFSSSAVARCSCSWILDFELREGVLEEQYLGTSARSTVPKAKRSRS
jgi:hypothetical protein